MTSSSSSSSRERELPPIQTSAPAVFVVKSPEELLVLDRARFQDVFGNNRFGQSLALRVALKKQVQRGLAAAPNPSVRQAAVDRKFVDNNMRQTVLRGFRRTQRLRRIGEEAADERQRQRAAKQHRSEISCELLHEEFVKRRLRQLRLEILTTNVLPAYSQQKVFRQALWLLHLSTGVVTGKLFDKLKRRKHVRDTMRFPAIIQNIWRAKQGLRVKKLKQEGMRKFLGAAKIMLILVRIYRKFLHRRWGVSVLVSVLKTKKQEYSVKMYMRRFAVALLKIQRWWSKAMEWKRSRVLIMTKYVTMLDASIHPQVCAKVCTQQFSVMKRKNFEKFGPLHKGLVNPLNARVPGKKPRAFWLLSVEDTRALAALCKKTASSLASELALQKKTSC